MKTWKQDDRAARGGWAPGSYHARCTKCRAEFIGAKRCFHCADCAYALPDVPSVPPAPSAIVTEREARLQKAIEKAISDLGVWLLENTDNVFEEQPDIDGIRTRLHDSLSDP